MGCQESKIAQRVSKPDVPPPVTLLENPVPGVRFPSNGTQKHSLANKFLARKRCGNWLPKDPQHAEAFMKYMHAAASESIRTSEPLIEPIKELENLVNSDVKLSNNVAEMFKVANSYKEQTPLNTPGVANFQEFLHMLNLIMKTAPAFYTKSQVDDSAAGLVGFPINALLDWPMATDAGFCVFQNMLFNRQFKKILSAWAVFLASPDSRYILTGKGLNVLGAPVLPWLDAHVRKQMLDVAFQWTGKEAPSDVNFEDVFECQPDQEFYGFASWDDFFTRKFRKEARPVGGPVIGGVTKPWPNGNSDDDIILNACESGPLQIQKNVKLQDEFWLKGQPYSLNDMLNFDPSAKLFEGGTVYQAFLSALSFHRWNSPVKGKIAKAFVVNGSYYLQSIYEGFSHISEPDDVAPNDSQPYLTAVATRAVIFIEAANPLIGLMCVVAVGMAEVSSCDITVKEGDTIEKGQELGMFHFGGSTHCLLFRRGVNLEFVDFDKQYHTGPIGLDATNVPVNSQLARVSSASI